MPAQPFKIKGAGAPPLGRLEIELKFHGNLPDLSSVLRMIHTAASVIDAKTNVFADPQSPIVVVTANGPDMQNININQGQQGAVAQGRSARATGAVKQSLGAQELAELGQALAELRNLLSQVNNAEQAKPTLEQVDTMRDQVSAPKPSMARIKRAWEHTKQWTSGALEFGAFSVAAGEQVKDLLARIGKLLG